MLHLRASNWFLEHGDLANAVAHAAQAGAVARAVTIIESAGAVRIGLMEGMPALRRVLRHVSKEDIYANPRLHLARIWLLAKQGEVGIARQQYDEFMSAKPQGGESGLTDYSDAHKESLFVGLMLAEVYEDKDFNRAEIQRIEAMAGDVSVVDHWFQGWVNNLLCVMHTRKGNLEAAAAVNEAATFHYRQVGSDYGQVWMLLHLADNQLSGRSAEGCEQGHRQGRATRVRRICQRLGTGRHRAGHRERPSAGTEPVRPGGGADPRRPDRNGKRRGLGGNLRPGLPHRHRAGLYP